MSVVPSTLMRSISEDEVAQDGVYDIHGGIAMEHRRSGFSHDICTIMLNLFSVGSFQEMCTRHHMAISTQTFTSA